MADMKPVRIFIEGKELLGWMKMTLKRAKKELTGDLTVEVFFTYVPRTPQMTQAVRGKEITVYIGGHLAFTGTLDKRKGAGRRGGQGRPASPGTGSRGGAGSRGGRGSAGAGGGGAGTKIGPNQYTVTLQARGKTKKLIDSSHAHRTGTILNARTRQVVETLIQPFGIRMNWRGPVHDMDKARFRDGGRVVDEIQRIGNEWGNHMWEGRDGTLNVSDKADMGKGEPLILGDNILEFHAEQSEDQANSHVKVKGQRTRRDTWGRAALIKRERTFRDNWVGNFSPLNLQHYTDGSDEGLERRGRFEMDNRAAQSKKIEITVFHVQSRDGKPWDIATLHYVEIPPEGIFGEFEVTELTYHVEKDKTLQTKLTLTPPPSSAGGGAGRSDATATGAARQAQLGITLVPGQYPDPWTPADIAQYTPDQTMPAAPVMQPAPPLVLPPHVQGDDVP